MADYPHATADERRTRVTSAEGRQATGARDRFAVLTASLMLAALEPFRFSWKRNQRL